MPRIKNQKVLAENNSTELEKSTELIEKSNSTEIVPVKLEIEQPELNVQINLGSLISNAKELKAFIINELQKYSVEKYLNNPEAAKKDRAFLNKVLDQLKEKLKEVKKRWNSPLDEFIAEMNDAINLVNDSVLKQKEIIDEVDKSERWTKQETIKSYFDSKNFSLVSFEKIFIKSWTNKTYDLKKIYVEIDNIIEKINSEIETLKNLKSDDTQTLLAYYLDCLDLQTTLNYSTELKAKKELLEQEKVIQTENQNVQKNEVLKPVEKPILQPVEKTNELMSFTLKLIGTKDQLIALRKYIDQNGISYEKL